MPERVESSRIFEEPVRKRIGTYLNRLEGTNTYAGPTDVSRETGLKTYNTDYHLRLLKKHGVAVKIEGVGYRLTSYGRILLKSELEVAEGERESE